MGWGQGSDLINSGYQMGEGGIVTDTNVSTDMVTNYDNELYWPLYADTNTLICRNNNLII